MLLNFMEMSIIHLNWLASVDKGYLCFFGVLFSVLFVWYVNWDSLETGFGF